MLINKYLQAGFKRTILMLLIVTLAGCAAWTRIDTVAQEGPGGKYRIQAPIGWVRYNLAQDGILITRDGLPIQHIRVSQQSDEDFFKQTKVKLAPGLLPSDLAQMVIAEMRSNKNLLNLEIRENVPYMVAGQPGFKVYFQYRDERGTLFDRIVLGTTKGKEVVTMVYHGLDTHYFARDLETFYTVAKSFKS